MVCRTVGLISSVGRAPDLQALGVIGLSPVSGTFAPP